MKSLFQYVGRGKIKNEVLFLCFQQPQEKREGQWKLIELGLEYIKKTESQGGKICNQEFSFLCSTSFTMNGVTSAMFSTPTRSSATWILQHWQEIYINAIGRRGKLCCRVMSSQHGSNISDGPNVNTLPVPAIVCRPLLWRTSSHSYTLQLRPHNSV